MTSIPQTKHHCTMSADKGYTRFKWSLKDWSLLSELYRDVVSPEFVLHNTDGKTCTLNFKLSGDQDSKDCTISADIQLSMGIEYLVMRVKWCIVDDNSINLDTTASMCRNSCRSCQLQFYFSTRKSSLSGYIRNDTLNFLFEFTIVKSRINSALRTDISGIDFSTDICQNVKVILDSKYDVTFVVRGKQLYAHKVVLEANSEVFRAMFTMFAEMKELEDGTVEIVDTDATVFEAFLSYMYTGRVSEIENMVDELIVVADKYQVMSLKKHCERYMLNHIKEDTVVTYLLKAYRLACNDLQKNCIYFVRANMHVLGNFPDLAKLSEFPSIVSQIFDKAATGKLVK